jgi:pimeloyl-ACP methyl ester carboxylesterase
MATLPLKAKTIAEPAEALRNLYPYLSIDVCIHIAKHGYSRSKGGRFIPKYDTQMGRQIERSDYVTEELYDMIKNVACPTLIIRGKESPFLSLEEAQRICAAFPQATLKEIAGATHMPAQENPDAFKKAVYDFLDEK